MTTALLNLKIREKNREEGAGMEKDKMVLELTDKAGMQQSIYAALRCLDEWEYDDGAIEATQILLRRVAKRLEKEIVELQDNIMDGKLDIDKAVQDDSLAARLELAGKMQQANGIRIEKELHNAGQSWQDGMKNIFCKTRR